VVNSKISKISLTGSQVQFLTLAGSVFRRTSLAVRSILSL